MGIDRETLKRAILELIEEDREFRYAIMAAAGLPGGT
jgi:formiminotetrahydrofolate cyclodeaminase